MAGWTNPNIMTAQDQQTQALVASLSSDPKYANWSTALSQGHSPGLTQPQMMGYGSSAPAGTPLTATQLQTYKAWVDAGSPREAGESIGSALMGFAKILGPMAAAAFGGNALMGGGAGGAIAGEAPLEGMAGSAGALSGGGAGGAALTGGGGYPAASTGGLMTAAGGAGIGGAGAGGSGAGLSTLASMIGIGAGANSLLGGGAGSSSQPNITGAGNTLYTPTGTGAADTSWQQMLSQMFGQQTGVNQQVADPMLQSYLKQLGINQQPLVQAGQQAGQQYGNLAGQAGGISNVLGQQGMGVLGAGNQVFNMGMDPQNQLHNFLQQQVQDQSRAGTSARGLGTSPYAAGIENDAMRNFNMDWQNQQLGRANTGLQGMVGANRAGATDLAGSLATGAQAPGFTMQGATTPIGAQTQAYGAPATAATNYAGNVQQAQMSPEQALMSQIIPYLNYGTGAGAQGAAAGLAGAQNQQGQQQLGLSNILAGMQAGNAPGGWLSGFGTNNFNNPSGYGNTAQDMSGFQNQAASNISTGFYG